MPSFLSRLLVLPLAGVLVLPTSAAYADDESDGSGGRNNVAVAVNTTDGSSVFRLAFSIQRIAGDIVTPGNAAVAYASCTDCQTVAIAIQVVLVTGDPEVVAPENVAIAINDACTACDTLASAYQIVLGTGERVRFSPDGQRALADIRRRLRALKKSDLDAIGLQAELDRIVGDLRVVIDTQLVPVRDDDDTTAAATPATSSTPSADSSATTGTSSASPSSEASSSSAPTEAASTAPSPSPTPSPTSTGSTSSGSAEPSPTATPAEPSPTAAP